MLSKYAPYHLRTGVIYKITNLIDGKAYVGQSTLFDRRIKEHMNWKYANSYVDRAIRLHGKERTNTQKPLIATKDGFCDYNISAVCKGKRKKHKGYSWRYA